LQSKLIGACAKQPESTVLTCVYGKYDYDLHVPMVASVGT